MTSHVSIPPAPDPAAASAMLIDAARCWRHARDGGLPVQPCLSRTLGAYHCPILAPVFDSLLHFYEDALGRPMVAGEAGGMTGDERRLVRLIDGSLPRRACIDCPEAAAIGLDCAICSTRIMMIAAWEAFAKETRIPGGARAGL